MPAMRLFSGPPDVGPMQRSNAQIARDFLDLSFQLESGRALPVFTRFEGPVTVRLEGLAPQSLVQDLDQLLERLRREAGIDIRRVTQGEASITIATVARAELNRAVPQAACFVSPRISSWAEFRATRQSALGDWTTLREREKMAVFVPWDVAPQEARDCLHEELAQALGPLNDLYRLPQSVFNDDNFHAVLTSFDMLILRATYAPELRSGMSQSEVAARLPAILARMNPAGGAGGIAPANPTPRAFNQLIETAIGGAGSLSSRRAAAARAIRLAQDAGWQDGRLGFAYYVQGRLSLGSYASSAPAAFAAAEALYRADPQMRVQWAHLAMQLVADSLLRGQFETALSLTDRAIPAAKDAQNAALLAQLLWMRGAALERLGRDEPAAAARGEAAGWARYGFGSEQEIRNRAADIARLAAAPIAAR